MNKITKIWVLWLALCMLLVTLHTNADTNANQKLRLQLTPWNNSCVMRDYDFWSQVLSTTALTVWPLSSWVYCTLLKSPAVKLQLSLEDLSNWTSTIARSNFTWSISGITVTWTIPNPWTTVAAFPFTSEKVVYIKTWNTTIGIRSWTLTIQWKIPFWTPDGIYTWALNLTITP